MRLQLPHVDVMVGDACQLRCIACTNLVGALPQTLERIEDIIRDVELAAEVMHAGCVCLLGGEPTSHPKLVEIMRETARSGLADRVQVLTNGMRLHRMRQEFWDELQWLKISIYPGRTPPENIAFAKAKQRDHGFQLDFYDVAADPFRAVMTAEPRTPDSAQRVYDGCWYRTFTRKIERGYFYRCCTSPSISQTILGLGPDADGIALDGLTPSSLQQFLDRPQPANACTRCHGHLGPRLEQWSEVRGRKAWLRASTVPAES
jgi:hypothetical protein